MNDKDYQALALQLSVDLLAPLFETYSRFWATHDDIAQRNADLHEQFSTVYQQLVPIYNELIKRGLVQKPE